MGWVLGVLVFTNLSGDAPARMRTQGWSMNCLSPICDKLSTKFERKHLETFITV